MSRAAHAPTAPACPATVDDATAALQARAFAWYLGAALVGVSLLWVVVPRLEPSLSLVAAGLLPTVVVFNALSLVVLWRVPRLLRALHLAQYASFFPFLLGYLALMFALADDAAARHAAVAAFGIWIPVVVAISFSVFGSREGLFAAVAFVAGTTAVIAVEVASGAALDGAGLAYVAMLLVSSLALAVIVYGTSRLAERLSAARLAAAVAAELALRDALTGVHTRYALEERFEQELARARRGGRPLAVYFLDLDGFKRVNDAHGHAIGDALLRAFAGRVQDVVRASDTVGRLGGDEFVVLASVAGDEEAHALAERLVASCAEPVALDGMDFELSVSIGVAVHPADGIDRDALLSAADAAMYVAKGARRCRWSAHVRREPAPAVGQGRGDGGARVDGARFDLACSALG